MCFGFLGYKKKGVWLGQQTHQVWMEGYVNVQNGWAPSVLPWHTEFIFPLSDYDRDLGMHTRSAVKRQLAVDVPRCKVIVNGSLTKNWEDVYRSTSNPRMCTQAAFAPVMEWLFREGLIAFEPKPRTPMKLQVDGNKISSRKEFLLRNESLTTQGSLIVDISVVGRQVVVALSMKEVVSSTRSSEGPQHHPCAPA